MIQDIKPHIYHNEYRKREPKPEDTLLCYDGKEILVRQKDGEISDLTFAEAEAHGENLMEKAIYLFSIDSMGKSRYFYLVPGFCPDAEGFSKEDINRMRTVGPAELAFAGVTGWQLDRFYRTRKYCSCCGNPLKHSEKERMLFCEACHHTEYPKISPAVIVGIRNGNRLLLTKYMPEGNIPDMPWWRDSMRSGRPSKRRFAGRSWRKWGFA